MTTRLPYARQSINAADKAAVLAVLESDWLTQGPVVPQFEAAVAARCGAAYGVATCNATAALHLACLALGLGRGDRLWTAPISFVASANCGLYCGATVDFVDIDPRSYNLCADALARKLATAEAQNRLPKLIVLPHLAGQPAALADIHALAAPYGIRIIEDAAHALGAEYAGVPIGASQYSAITVFSFHPVKIITTGEGGMALTQDPQLAERLALLRSHGITRDPAKMTEATHGEWYYQQLDLGFNYRMSDLHAALGLSQLQRLDEFIARRRALAARYTDRLSHLPLTLPWQHPDTRSSWHLYLVRLSADYSPAAHRAIFHALRQRGIGVNLHYIPIHLQPLYRQRGFAEGDFPVAEQYYQQALTLPLYPELTDSEQDTVIAALEAVL